MNRILSPKSIQSLTTPFRLRYISDLHLEFYHLHNHPYPRLITHNEDEYLALCGDIGNPLFPNYTDYLHAVSRQFKRVFLVSGNHEYYQVFNIEKKTISQINQTIQDICDRFPNVDFINNRTIDVEGNISIAGTTLWSYTPPERIMHGHRVMGDYHCIYNDNGNTFTPHDSNSLNARNVSWLVNQIDLTKQRNRRLIVLSHHMPSHQLIADKYKGSALSVFFANQLDHLLKPPVVAWLCGHSHDHQNKLINGVYCGINAVGYYKETTGYKNDQVLELDQ